MSSRIEQIIEEIEDILTVVNSRHYPTARSL